MWQTLFVKGAGPWIYVPANALLGPLGAVLSFVCSTGKLRSADNRDAGRSAPVISERLGVGDDRRLGKSLFRPIAAFHE